MTPGLGFLIYVGAAVVSASALWSVGILLGVEPEGDDVGVIIGASLLWPLTATVAVVALLTVPARLVRNRIEAARGRDAERRALLVESVDDMARRL